MNIKVSVFRMRVAHLLVGLVRHTVEGGAQSGEGLRELEDHLVDEHHVPDGSAGTRCASHPGREGGGG